MARTPFTLADIERDCRVQSGIHTLDGRPLGLRITVPAELHAQHPYNASAYAFLQHLRAAIFEYGTLEFPGLPVNRCNHTLAQRSPEQHRYSANPYLTDYYQAPHQDTPPYPTAFWLGAPRRYFGTWVISLQGLHRYSQYTREHPQHDIENIHRALVPESLANGTGLILNREPGLLLIDNSEHRHLYHARSADITALANHPQPSEETPMYAFNEIGLLHYINTLDERRGTQDRDAEDLAETQAFMAAKPLA
ncbi:MAG: hypothetical protein EP312_05985 [Gammaproteobacteria bacterium]|nr:MAG: hypothetical protein EP312_05985 [Gammaproteobacteria bacterium]